MPISRENLRILPSESTFTPIDSLFHQAVIFFTIFRREAQRKQAGKRHQLARAGEQLRACLDRIEDAL